MKFMQVFLDMKYSQLSWCSPLLEPQQQPFYIKKFLRAKKENFHNKDLNNKFFKLILKISNFSEQSQICNIILWKIWRYNEFHVFARSPPFASKRFLKKSLPIPIEKNPAYLHGISSKNYSGSFCTGNVL